MKYDVAVIGGGFYGCHIALQQARMGRKVVLFEKAALFTEASFYNQARAHLGFHYPRAPKTSSDCARNYEKFNEFYKSAVVNDFEHFYAIAKCDSKTNFNDYLKFCDNLSLKYHKSNKLDALFYKDKTEGYISTTECAFDTSKLLKFFEEEFKALDIAVIYKEIVGVEDCLGNLVLIAKDNQRLIAKKTYACLYAETNSFLRKINAKPIENLEFQLTETILLDLPDYIINQFEKFAITVMDGPFFSLMPFPARNCYSLTHVSHGIHHKYADNECPLFKESKADKIIHAAASFLPFLLDARMKSCFSIRKLIDKNVKDERPAIIQNYFEGLMTVVIGSKLVNIFDYFPIEE